MIKMIEKTREGNANSSPPQDPTRTGHRVVKHYFAGGAQASASVLLFIKKLWQVY